LPVEERCEPRAESAHVGRLDVLERQVLLQSEGDVEMAPGAHADRDRHVLQVPGPADLRFRANEDGPGRDAVAVGHHAAHPGARVADRPPHAGALDDLLAPALGVRLVLRALKAIALLPARLGAAEGLPVDLDFDAFVRVEPFLGGDEVVEPHALRGDLDVRQLAGHACLLARASTAATIRSARRYNWRDT